MFPQFKRLAFERRKKMNMTLLVNGLTKFGILKWDVDYHLIRASLVLLFLLFGYQKWFQYEADALVPYIKNGPLIFWMYPLFGMQGATWFLGVAEWLLCALLFLGFWNKKLGIIGALGACFSFVATVTIIPFIPNGWAESAGGFPAMTERVAFLLKDVVLFAASFYLLKQDLARASLSSVTKDSFSRRERDPESEILQNGLGRKIEGNLNGTRGEVLAPLKGGRANVFCKR